MNIFITAIVFVLGYSLIDLLLNGFDKSVMLNLIHVWIIIFMFSSTLYITEANKTW